MMCCIIKQSFVYVSFLIVVSADVLKGIDFGVFKPPKRLNDHSKEFQAGLFKQTKPEIRFNKDGKLKIVNFSDLHYGEAPHTDWGPGADIKTTNVTKNILKLEQPDFVVFTGDLLTAEEMYPNATDYVAQLFGPMVEGNYRWASTYGNHDIGENMTRLELLEAEQKFQQSYTFQMHADLPGVTNYLLPIYPADGDQPVMIWWFFDSQGGRTDDGSTGKGQQPEHIDKAVVRWFEDQHLILNMLFGDLPSLVFFHIPPFEFINIQEHIKMNPKCSGLVDDDVSAQDKNTGIMEALLKSEGAFAVFVGHDHGNAWCCFYAHIQVCYNRHTGYGGYGSWERGARVINLNIDDLTKATTYIRMEDGTIIDAFPNSSQLIKPLKYIGIVVILLSLFQN